MVVVEADEDDGLPSVWSDAAAAAATALTFPRRLKFEFVYSRVGRDTVLPTSALLRPRGEEKWENEDDEEERVNAETTMPPRLPASLLCCCCCCSSTRGDTEAAHGERAARAAALISIRIGRGWRR